MAAKAKAKALAEKADERPYLSPKVPMRNGARALIPRAVLYEMPSAVARMRVGNNSVPKIAEPEKEPPPKKAVMVAVNKMRAGWRATAKAGTDTAPIAR